MGQQWHNGHPAPSSGQICFSASAVPHYFLLPLESAQLCLPAYRHPTWRMCDYLLQTYSRGSPLAAKRLGALELQLGKSLQLELEPPAARVPLEEAGSAT